VPVHPVPEAIAAPQPGSLTITLDATDTAAQKNRVVIAGPGGLTITVDSAAATDSRLPAPRMVETKQLTEITPVRALAPASPRRLHALREAAGRDKKRTILAITTVAAVIAAGSIALPATFGAFTAQTQNPNNTFTAGTLTMSNSRQGAYIISGSNIAPGDSGTFTVTVTNTGSLSATMSLAESLSSGWSSYGRCADNNPAPELGCSDLSYGQAYSPNGINDTAPPLGLQLKIDDVTNGSPVGIYNGTFAPNGSVTGVGTRSLAGSAAGGKWAPGEARKFQFSWDLPINADNTYQGTKASADFSFNAVQ
jgi:hypothetical protein